jgi:hypothetical protein
VSSLDKVLRLTPRTPVASTVHERVGPGPLWHHKDLQLPAYIQHVANDLREKGHDESKAIAMAVGIVRDWAAGRMPHGKGHIHPDVRAAARKAMAEWEAVKAKAHSETAAKDSERGTVKATATSPDTAPATVSGAKLIPLPPVPGGKVPRAMFTAHRIDDTICSLAHARERLAQARGSKALRAYHMIHVNNHLTRSLDTAGKLVDSVKRNYLPEARELAALNKTMGLAASVSTDAKVATFAHLLQTLLYHMAHAKRHAAVMLDPDPAAVWTFNADHAETHLDGAQEHAYKLSRHLRDNYPEEAKWLKLLDEDENPLTPMVKLAAQAAGPGPVKTKVEAHYRESDSGTRRCGTCSMFRDGSCTLVKGSIEPDHVCDYWEHSAKVKLASPVATAPGAKPVAGPYQVPSQTVSPSPPLPPEVKLPTAAEIRKLIGQVPECTDASLSQSARNHLDAAAVKLEKDDPIAALHVLRSAQSDVYAAHKADLGMAAPAVYTASVFTRVPSAEQSSANTEMIRSKGREMAWRKLEYQVAVAIDKIRRKHFHGVYPAGMQQARFSGETALGKVVRLSSAD